MRIEDVHDDLSGGHYFNNVVLLDGKLERGSEEQDGVNGGWRAGSVDWRGLEAMVAVKDHIQVVNVVDWCVADHTSPLKAGQISGARYLRVLAASLSV